MKGLGKDFNVVAVADGVWLNMRDYTGVTFISINAAGETITIQEATAQAGTGNVDLVVIDESWVQATGNGTEVWSRLTQTAAATEVFSASQDVGAVYVDQDDLSDGFDFVSCASTSTGLVIAILHGLAVQRAPENLPAVSA